MCEILSEKFVEPVNRFEERLMSVFFFFFRFSSTFIFFFSPLQRVCHPTTLCSCPQFASAAKRNT